MRKFQEHQKAALQQSAKLKTLMAITIVGTVLITASAITYLHLVWMVIDSKLDPGQDGIWLGFTFFATVLITSVVVGVGTMIKQMQLQDGGKVIAEDLGGQLLTEPRDQEERQLLNIIEEMSIASGIPVPPIYILECDGINAFAAGHDSEDCVFGITRGAIRLLKREEMQGVVAHEFGHILNGDMKLNMWMVGWLHGVLAIRIVAAELIEQGTKPQNTSKYSRNPGGQFILVIIGCVLWPIGQIGAFLSALVKSATNRQREFLADAYAVEFTRNPEGIANAMKRLIGHNQGGRVASPRAIEASHMFFATSTRLAEKMKTHPPMAERILRLTPGWDGVPLFECESELEEYDGAFQDALSLVSTTKESIETRMQSTASTDLGDRATYVPEFAATLAFVAGVMEGVPEPLVKLAETRGGTALVVYALWLAHAEDKSVAVEIIGPGDEGRIEQLIAVLKPLCPAQQLLIFDTVIKHVAESDSIELAELRTKSVALMERSEDGNLFQWMWKVVMSDILELREPDKPRYGDLKQVAQACGVVLSQVCHGGSTGAFAQFSFQRGLANLGLDNVSLRSEEEYSWETFEQALDLVAELAPTPRRQVALACSSAMSSDQEVTNEEAYLIRGICQRLGYEMPCVVPGQPILPGT